MAVPGNRWDLAPTAPTAPAVLPTVSVVVPYYDAPRQLELVLAGLGLQDYPGTRYEVIVADDGSPVPPRVPTTIGDGVPVRLVRQQDRGFRAGAARNLGVAAADGELLAFVDADTVPSPDYLTRLTRLPAVLPDALVTGRRRHVDLSGWDADQVRAWLTGARPGPEELTEPAWLIDGYRWSGDLLTADDRSYRYLISAVMCCSRMLFAEIGGFDESFDRYGGEDWELAYRAWNAGAVLAHARDAVAWHDGPDWAGRGPQQQGKDAEREALARLIPEPLTRDQGAAGPYRKVDLVVILTDPAPNLEMVAGTVRSLLDAGLDLAVYLDPAVHRNLPADLGADLRVRTGRPPADVLAAARYQLVLPAPVRLGPGAVAALTERLLSGEVGRICVPTPAGPVVAFTTRAARRVDRWAAFAGDIDLMELFFGATTCTSAQAGIRAASAQPASGL